MAKLKVVRGIENKKGRIEAGEKVDRKDLEDHFSKKTVAHWLKKGVLKSTRGR